MRLTLRTVALAAIAALTAAVLMVRPAPFGPPAAVAAQPGALPADLGRAPAHAVAFDPMAVVKTYLPNHTTEKVGNKTVYRSPDVEAEFYFPDNRHIVIGIDGSLSHYLAKAPAKDGPLAPALKLAAGGTKVMVASA